MRQPAAERPVFTVIGGPNGAGKSTFTDALRRTRYALGEIVNPDVIAAALPGPDAARDARSGRETLRRTGARIANGATFSRETTLSSREILRTMQAAKAAGFEVNLFFVGVDRLDTSQSRVRQRVAQGGHDIPPEAQARRFERVFDNASRAAALADTTYFIHSGSNREFRLVGIARDGALVWRARPVGPRWFDRVAQDLTRTT